MDDIQSMLNGPSINYWAVLVAGIVYWVIGAIWYAKPVFGAAWMQGIGKTEEQIQQEFSPLNLVWVFIAGLIAAYGIARVDLWYPGAELFDTVMVAVLAWFCFSMMTMAMNDVMEKRPCGLRMINAFYHLVGFVVMGIIIGIWH